MTEGKDENGKEEVKKDEEEVSYLDKLKDFEENYIYDRLPRLLYNVKDSTRHFVKNPLLNFPNYDP